MSTLEQSFTRLREGAWVASPGIAATNDATCKFQSLADGSGGYVHDEYSIMVSGMPPGLTPGGFMLEFANNPNATVKNGYFTALTVLTKRTSTPPKIGDIYDIDIIGPDNGSIVLVALAPDFGKSGDSWFDIQTVSCEKYGSHPENGAREFGCESTAEGIRFYTRGISRPSNALVRFVGAAPQALGWTAMMKGISESIKKRGGTPVDNSFRVIKYTKAA